MNAVDERDIIDALNRATDETIVRDLLTRAGRDWLAEQGFHLIADEPSSFTDAGAEPCDVVSQSVAARPGVPSTETCPTDAQGNLGRAKPRSKAGG